MHRAGSNLVLNDGGENDILIFVFITVTFISTNDLSLTATEADRRCPVGTELRVCRFLSSTGLFGISIRPRRRPRRGRRLSML